MISGGVVLDDNKRLQDQRVSNNSQILALMLSTDLDSQRVFVYLMKKVQVPGINNKTNLIIYLDGRENYPRS